MPVDNKHVDYVRAAASWRRIRAVVEGEDSVKMSGEEFLPKLKGQTDVEYRAYRDRAMFYEAASRTVEALVGMIMRKPPTVMFPKDRQDELKDIGRRNEPLDELLTKACDEIVSVARVGHLVDAPAADSSGSGVDQPRPYIVEYPAESIYNWEEGIVNGIKQPVLVVLRETRMDPDPEDPEFGRVEVTFFRVLKLGSPVDRFGEDLEQLSEEELRSVFSDFTENGPVYLQEIWEKVETNEDGEDVWEKTKTIVPKMAGGRELREIPFAITTARDTSFEMAKSPIGGLVSVNLSHYRNSADLEHGRHLTALPTPWAVGFEAKTELRIGSATAWTTENEKAKFGFLEFTGEGLGHLQEGMIHKEKLMATLAARVLESAPAGVEAAETVKLRHSGEQSALARVSSSISDSFTKLLMWYSIWEGIATADDVSVELNKDFNLIGIDAGLLRELFQGVQAGLISWNTLFFNIKKGELVPDDISAEDEAALIAAGPPEGPETTEEEITPPGNEEEEESGEEEEQTSAA